MDKLVKDDIYKKLSELDNENVCSTVKRNGTTYFRDSSGLVIDKPIERYTSEFLWYVNKLTTSYPELKSQFDKLTPIFTNRVGTFATGNINDTGVVNYYLFMNPIFWNKLQKKDPFAIIFVIIHELYHHIMGHMNLSKAMIDTYKDQRANNVAMDLSINGLIEELYGMDGMTKKIGGLINNECNGRPWQDILHHIPKSEMDELKKEKQWRLKVKGHGESKVELNKEQGPTPPPPYTPPMDIYFSDDFKQGDKDAANEIRHILKDLKDKGATIQEAIDIFKDIATGYGVNVTVNESLVLGNNEDYDEGVRNKYVAILKALDRKRSQLAGSDDFELDKGSENKPDINIEELEKLWAEESLSRGSGSGEGEESKDNKKNDSSDDSKDNKKNENPSGKREKSDKDIANEAADEAENAADTADKAATIAEQKANKTGDPSDEEAAQKSREAAQKSREAAQKSREAAQRMENGGSQGDLQEALDECERAKSECNNAIDEAEGALTDENGPLNNDDPSDIMSEDEMNAALDEQFGDGRTVDSNQGEISNDEKEKIKSDLEKHLDNLKDTKVDNESEWQRERRINSTEKLKGNLNKIFPIVRIEGEIDWKQELESFLTNTVANQPKTMIKEPPLLMNDNDAIIRFRKQRGGKPIYELRRIVIGLDNSGSVCSENSLPGFLGELGNLIDNTLKEDCIIDFIQFSGHVDKCTRVIHKEGATISEIKKVQKADGGSTHYDEILKEMSDSMDHWEEIRDKNTPDVFAPIREGIADGQQVQEACCAILFTDTDFASEYTKKYYDIDLGKLLIIGINFKGIKLLGKDSIFNECIRPISKSNWKYGDVINESVFDGMGIDMSLETMQKDLDAQFAELKSHTKIDEAKKYADILISEYALDPNKVEVNDNGLVEINQDIAITNFDAVILDDVIINGNIILLTKPKKGYEDRVYYRPNGCNFPRSIKPDKNLTINGAITFDSDDSLTYGEYENYVDTLKENKVCYNVYYVNCPKITNELIQRGYDRQEAFSNNATLILPYLETYLTDLLENTNISNSYIVYSNGKQEFEKIASFQKNGNSVSKDLSGVGSLEIGSKLYISPSKNEITINIRNESGVKLPNSSKYNLDKYGINECGFPPFVCFYNKKMRVVLSSTVKDVSEDLFPHKGEKTQFIRGTKTSERLDY